MAIHIEYKGGDTQWIRGGDNRLPVRLQKTPDGSWPIAMAPDEIVTNWARKPAPFADKHDSHVHLFRTHQMNWMRREYMHAGERFDQ